MGLADQSGASLAFAPPLWYSDTMPEPVYTSTLNNRSTPPRPDRERQQFSAIARAILYGQWDSILQAKVRDRVGTQRQKAWQDVDLSANVYRVAASGLSALYDEPGEVIHESEEDAKFMADLLELSEWWPYMQRVQRDTWALREVHVGVSWDPDDKIPVYDTVYPDLTHVIARAARPTQPMTVMGRGLVW